MPSLSRVVPRLRLGALLLALLPLGGCTVVAVGVGAASLAVGAASLAVDATVGAAKLTGAAVGAVLPDGDDED